MGAGCDDLVVEGIYQVGNFRRGARSDFFDSGDAVLLVAGADALGAVASVEVLVELEVREIFEHRVTIFFGATGVNGGLVDDDVATL